MEPIKKLFQGKVFKKYEQKKSELEDLQKKFVKNIPKEIHSNVKVKNKIGGLIIVETTSSAVAHKIKMTSSSILNKINNDNSLNLEKNQLLSEKEESDKNYHDLSDQHEELKSELEKINKDVGNKFGSNNNLNKKIDELNQETENLIDEIEKWQT